VRAPGRSYAPNVRTLGSRWLPAAVVSAVASLAWAAPASAAATTYCVPSTGPQCSGTAEPDIQSALNAAGGDGAKDIIKVAAGTYTGPFFDNSGNPVDLIGSGLGTVLQGGGGASTLRVTEPTTTISSLKVVAANGAIGADSSGTFLHVAVGESAGASGVVGVFLETNGRFEQGVVSLSDSSSTGVDLGGGTLSRSAVTAGSVGVHGLETGTAVDDLIRVTKSNGTGVQLAGALYGSSINARQDTVIGPGVSTTSTGVEVDASPPAAGFGGGPGDAHLNGVIIRNFHKDLAAQGVDGTCGFYPDTYPCPQDATINIAYSDFNPANDTLGVHSFITEGASNLHNVDPKFANPFGGDFSLKFGSPVVDKANPNAPPSGDPILDLLGTLRKIDGDGNGIARVDMGAFELDVPVAAFKAPRYAVVGTKAHFNGSASHDPSGRPITFAWLFGDGSKGTGAKPTHTYKAPGTYKVKLVVTNSLGVSSRPVVNKLPVFQSRPCIVPNLRGKTVAAADKALAAAHCKPGKVTRASSKTVPSGRVISSKPPAGHLGPPGTKVNLVVSRGP